MTGGGGRSGSTSNSSICPNERMRERGKGEERGVFLPTLPGRKKEIKRVITLFFSHRERKRKGEKEDTIDGL